MLQEKTTTVAITTIVAAITTIVAANVPTSYIYMEHLPKYYLDTSE